ncbi:MAG: hypothetical protein JWQ16_2267 [Novosphingobium sp.]|nr:hypothetical protein [Novosphingobium sp.]
MKLKTRLLACTAAVIATCAAVSAHAAPSEACDTAAVQAMAPAGATVAFAAREFGGGCRVHGYVTTNNPGPNRVLFVLMLPDEPNGRYLYIGVGGAAGVLPTVPSELYRRGYIIAGSDGGTGAKTGADFSFKSDPGKAADFAGRGVHVSAQATQAIAAAYYKRQPTGRYITGCSGGGQMGLTNAMRFGREDFDGFIVGATPLPGSTFHPNIYRVMHYIQNHPDGWISPELARKADAAIMARYDASDGAVDGVIADARNIKDFDEGILRGVGFTPAQIAEFNAIRQATALPLPEMQGRMQPGFPIANLAGWTRYPLGRSAPPWPSTATASPGELQKLGASFYHIMVDTKVRNHEPGTYYADIKDPAHLARLGLAEMEFQGSLDTAARSGAKVIVFHGVNDEAMSYLETMESYRDVAAKYSNHADWLRVFPVAGLMHCRGGVGPTDAPEQLLEAVAAWVEHGQAPETVVTNRSAMPFNWIEQGRLETVVPADKARDWEREFRLCAEPARVTLKQPGLDPKRADSWMCAIPTPG